MRDLVTILLTLFCITLGYSAQAKEPPLVIPKGPFEVNLLGNAQWLEADHTSFSLGQLQVTQSHQFETLTQIPILKADHIYWFRFRILNPLDVPVPIALTLGQGPYYVQAAYNFQNDLWQRLPGYERPTRLNARRAIQILVPANSDQWIYLRLASDKTVALMPSLSNMGQYTQNILSLEQLLGAVMALMCFIALTHIVASQFHNHVRHVLVISMAIMGMLYILNYFPLSHWPAFLSNLNHLVPWGMGSCLALSSFNTLSYRLWLRSSRALIAMLIFIMITLFLFTMSVETVWIVSLIPIAFAIYRSTPHSLTLTVSAMLLFAFYSWQILYSFWPETVPHQSSFIELATPAVSVLIASMSMIITYFRRQKVLHKPSSTSNGNAEFLSKLTHELRTPMNGVLGMSELLSDTSLSTTQRDYLETIQLAGHDILLLVNRISDYSKLTTGRLQLEELNVELSELMDETLKKFQFNANQKRLELVLNVASDIPTRLKLDSQRLQTIVDNLLENALNNTEHGEVELRIGWDESAPGKRLFFQVRDTGSGISKEDLRRVFSAFDLFDPQKDQSVQGTGLGLALSKRLVELMGGEIFADSTIGVGSNFSFSLPYYPAPRALDEEDESHLLNGLSLLIVDDNSTLRKVIQKYAKSWGMQADSTYSGKEALAMLRTKANLGTPYDIILIDQDMPIMNGFQLAERMHEDQEINDGLLKIMLTGLGISSTHKEARKFGIHQVITKPVSSRALKHALAKHVKDKKMIERVRPSAGKLPQ